ncbi:hypothetical protein FRC00_003340 [Tulasnella sp. 408]|nr:hypothetical protein FRC00_003340 [Tulasnella sp. 408]
MLPAKIQRQQRKRLRLRLRDKEDRLNNIANYRALSVDAVFEEIKASLPTPGTPVYEFEVYWTIMSPRGFGVTHRAAFCTCEAMPAAP